MWGWADGFCVSALFPDEEELEEDISEGEAPKVKKKKKAKKSKESKSSKRNRQRREVCVCACAPRKKYYNFGAIPSISWSCSIYLYPL